MFLTRVLGAASKTSNRGKSEIRDATATKRVITLRPAQHDDEPFLYSVYASTRADELAPLPWNDEQKTAFLRVQFGEQHAQYHAAYAHADFSIVQLGDEPTGRLYVNRGDEEILLVDIALLPAFRGLGIGTRLVAELLTEAALADKTVQLHVEPENPARRLYERLGFEFDQDVGVYWSMRWRPTVTGDQVALEETR